MKKITKKKTLTAVTGATVIGVAAAALVNGSKLESVFNPGKFEKFENNYKSEEYDYVSGDGEKTDISGDNTQKKEKNKGDNLQVLQLQKQDNGKLNDPSSFGIADNGTVPEESDNADAQENAGNGIELSQTDNTGNGDTILQNNGNGSGGNSGSGSGTGNGNGQNGNGGSNGNQGGTTITPSPSNDDPVPTSAPTPTGSPSNPTPSPTPAVITPAQPTPVPTSVPETPTPTPTPNPWTDDRDSVTTEDGELIALNAEISREYYTFGETYQAEDGTVTATFRQKDGTTKEKILSYGGSDGYSVTLSTVKAGRQIAVFTYRGMSARAYYTVLRSNVVLNYMVKYSGDDRIYSLAFPGDVLKKNNGEAFYSTLKKYTETPYNYAKNGNYVDLTEVHRRYIAILGDSGIREAFQSEDAKNISANYPNTVFLEETDGYLTTMLQGFRWTNSNTLMDTERAYLYYPMGNWDYVSRNVLDYVGEVPEGYKIRRVTENEGSDTYQADQVLEKYTGNDAVLTVPMGVTKVKLNEANQSVTTFAITQGVQDIDILSVSSNLPNLQEYRVADEDELHADFSISDGILYSRDGKTLLSVPAGRKNVEIPSTVTTLGENCLSGLSEDAVVTFKSEKPPVLKGKTGFKGTIQVPSSSYNTICKNYMFRFGDECSNLVFATEDGQKDLYEFSSNEQVLFEKGSDGILAAVPQNTRGVYTVPETVKTIGEGAFVGCSSLTDLIIGENVKKLEDNSLVLSGQVDSVTVKNPNLVISGHIFGTPETDKVNLDLNIFVPTEYYEKMLKLWSSILDPVYGEGTAENLLQTEEENGYLYEDGAKYRQITTGGKTTYQLLRVYQSDKTAFRIKEGTTEIREGAFSGCEDLEILLVPETVKTAGKNFLSDCKSLEMVASESRTLFAEETYGAAADVEILTKGKEFTDFGWENGILYGSTADGWTLLNVPTDYAENIKIWKKTTAFYKNAMKNCKLPNGFVLQDDLAIQKIGDSCFENCESSMYVNFTGCTNLTEIGDNAFRNCVNIQKFIFEDSVKKIGKGAFYNCTIMEEITAPGVVEIGDEAFYGCGSLMETDIFTSVEVLGDSAFYGCTNLTEVVLPETLSSMGESCFENCTILKRVVIDGTINGISRYCFYGCRTLSEVVFQDSLAKSSSIKGIGVRAFGNCTSLERLDLSAQSGLEVMGARTFEGCVNLTNIKLPENLQQIPDYCFEGCDALSIVQLGGDAVVELGDRVFGEKDELPQFLHIWVKKEMLSQYQDAYQPVLDPVYGEGTTETLLGEINEKQEYIRGILFENTEEGRVLVKASEELSGEYVLPEDTVRVADDAFAGCDKLTGFATADGTNVVLGNRCFKGCTGLQTVKLLGNITEWGEETFMDCTGLEKLSLGNTGAEIQGIGVRAFKNCTSLAASSPIEIRAAIEVYGDECFAGCTNLASIAYTEAARTAMRVIGNSAFRDCEKLTALLTSKLTGLTYIGDYAFANCDTLKQPAVPANVTYVGEGCFMDCNNILYVSFYCGLEEYPKDCFKNCSKLIRTGGTAAAFNGLKRIGESAYEGCASLTSSTSWNLGRYANLEEIGDRAFYGCATMADTMLNKEETENIVMAGTLNRIGASAFAGCTSFHTLWLQSVTPPAFGAFSTVDLAEDFLIRVPDSQEQEDYIYKAYLECLTQLLGKEEAYRILDSFSDGAKERQAETISEDGKAEDNTGIGEISEISEIQRETDGPGVIEEVTETPRPSTIPEENTSEREETETTPEPEEPETPEESETPQQPEDEDSATEDSQQTAENVDVAQNAENAKQEEGAKEKES